jgi:hypothetical protein
MWWFVFLCCIVFVFVYVYQSSHPQHFETVKTKIQDTIVSLGFMPCIFQIIRSHNIGLTQQQEKLIVTNLTRIKEEWCKGKPVRHLLEGVLTLVFPDFALVLKTSQMLFRAQNSIPQNPILQKTSADQIEYLLEIGVPEETIVVLQQKGCLVDLVSYLQTPDHKTCAITLEDLLVNGKLIGSVSMILQQNSETQQKHIYLYETEALNHWFNVRLEQTNPLTRKVVDIGREVIRLN